MEAKGQVRVREAVDVALLQGLGAKANEPHVAVICIKGKRDGGQAFSDRTKGEQQRQRGGHLTETTVAMGIMPKPSNVLRCWITYCWRSLTLRRP